MMKGTLSLQVYNFNYSNKPHSSVNVQLGMCWNVFPVKWDRNVSSNGIYGNSRNRNFFYIFIIIYLYNFFTSWPFRGKERNPAGEGKEEDDVEIGQSLFERKSHRWKRECDARIPKPRHLTQKQERTWLQYDGSLTQMHTHFE